MNVARRLSSLPCPRLDRAFSRVAFVLVATATLGASAGCSPSALTKDVVQSATPAAVTSGLNALDDPQNQKRLAHLVNGPEAKALRNDLISGTVGEALHSASQGMVREALRPQTERDVELIVARMVRASANGISEAELSSRMAGALQDDIGPAMQSMAREHIGPAVAEVLEGEQLQRAMGAMTRGMGRELVLGIQQGLAETQDSRPPGEPTLLMRMTNAAAAGAAVASGATWILGALALLFAIWAVRLQFKVKRFDRDAEERALRSRLLREASQASVGKPWASELMDALEERYRADEDAALRVHSRARVSGTGVH